MEKNGRDSLHHCISLIWIILYISFQVLNYATNEGYLDINWICSNQTGHHKHSMIMSYQSRLQQTTLFFHCFSEKKIRLDVSSESSAIDMKNQALFSQKDKSKKLKAIAIDSRLSPAKVRWRQPAVSSELSLVTAS